MKRLIVSMLVAAGLTGCERPATSVAVFANGENLACDKGFASLVDEIASSPGIVADIGTRGVSSYRDDRTSTVYLATLPDHPAHPAIFKRSVAATTEGNFIVSAACGYGDQAAMDREVRAYAAFDKLLNAENHCYLCDSKRLESPTVGRQLPPPPDGSERP